MPDATAPNFLAFCKELFYPPANDRRWQCEKGRAEIEQHADDAARHIRELLSYIVVGLRFIKSVAIFQGTTDSGKTTLYELLQMLLPASAIAARSIGKMKNDDFA